MRPGFRTKPLPRTPSELIVLVVDDYEDTRLLYAMVLEGAGFAVVVASDGGEAIEHAARLRPHVIFMDMSMPFVDGWDATRRIRAADGGDGPFIIAVTAASDSSSRQRAFDAGCDAFQAKPCAPETLLAWVGAASGADASGSGFPT
jgi:CheY-like chemotaxis protein